MKKRTNSTRKTVSKERTPAGKIATSGGGETSKIKRRLGKKSGAD